jgi:pantothenate synthetase
LAALTSKATKNSRVFAAVRLGNIRLIDNMPIG